MSTKNLHKQKSESEMEDEVKNAQPNVTSDYESDTSSENEEGMIMLYNNMDRETMTGITYVLVHNHQPGIKKY